MKAASNVCFMSNYPREPGLSASTDLISYAECGI